jgi:glycosyltransferase involved in cell wall biosynthesis
MKIAIIIGTYLPGYRAGGPVRSISNLVESLGDRINIRVVTSNKDFGEKKPYEGIRPNTWEKVGKAKVYYSDKSNFRISFLNKLALKVDCIYICGTYNIYTMKMLLLKKLHFINKPIIIAPMGGLSTGAVNIKKTKKKMFLFLFDKLGMFKDIFWSVTDEIEKKDVIENIHAELSNIYISHDLVTEYECMFKQRNKEKGAARVVFLSRISREKNLLYALEILTHVNGNVRLDIYGPIEDEEYWDECKRKVKSLSKNIHVEYKGVVDADKVVECFGQYHIFLFPTMSENFGHVIFESLAAGCPVVISDNTPWTKDILKDAGEIISLKDKELFVKYIQNFVDMGQKEYDLCSTDAVRCAKEFIEGQRKENGYLSMFESVLKV